MVTGGGFKQTAVIFKNAVRTSNRTQHFTVINVNLLTLLKELIPVSSEKIRNPYKSAELMIVKAAGTYTYHSSLKC
jgi:hypothetical protein